MGRGKKGGQKGRGGSRAGPAAWGVRVGVEGEEQEESRGTQGAKGAEDPREEKEGGDGNKRRGWTAVGGKEAEGGGQVGGERGRKEGGARGKP